MSGYTPVFGSVFDGTLCGKWPDTGVWVCLLALADWRGHIDMTHQAIAVRLGIPIDMLRECVGRFCSPDVESRSKSEEGRRLAPLEPGREWGWRVVNIELYRKKARDLNDVASGKAAERAKRYRERHAASRSVTPDHATHTHTQTKTRVRGDRAKRASRVPEDFSPDLDFARSQCPGIDAAREAQKFRDWEFKTPRSDWPACWRNWIERCRETGNYARVGRTEGANGLKFAN